MDISDRSGRHGRRTTIRRIISARCIAVEAEHDTTAKTIFGNMTIPAGQTAEQDLDTVLDALMQQPTMAPFVSKQLIQHMVTSNPSPAYVQRVSQVFSNDGTGVREYEGRDHRDSDGSGSARRRRSAAPRPTQISAICASRCCSWPTCCAV